jgi:hypothetical protein
MVFKIFSCSSCLFIGITDDEDDDDDCVVDDDDDEDDDDDDDDDDMYDVDDVRVGNDDICFKLF